MTEDDFWSLIERLDWHHEGDDRRVIEPVVAALAARPLAEIQSFQDLLAAKLFALDGRAWAKESGVVWSADDESVSADGFLYARCVVVANGRALYETVLADPSRMPKDLEFEALLWVADDAYQRRMGAIGHLHPKVSYETFANSDGWR